jgi:transcriptional regulator with XRE-family HTH domain
MTRAKDEKIAEQIREFGCSLRRARQNAGLTQAELSSAALLDRAALSRLECGQRAPDLSTLLRACAALDAKPDALLKGIGTGASVSGGRLRKRRGTYDPATAFGANLRQARSRAGLSQEQLALDAKVDRAAISVYENGGRQPNLRTVLKLASRLEVQPALLLQHIV